ncbi:hypothetical protein AY633_06530 [Planococcus maritimus]|nr:hypothetical protein AY633_06530 [Planococcus maritimus]
MIIHSLEIKERIRTEILSVNTEILIVSAFAKIETLKWIDLHSKLNIKKVCLVRFRAEDILAGVTDLEMFEYCINNGWEMYINDKVHSKIYCFDRKKYLIGSANLTHSGLGLKGNSNIETMVYGSLSFDEYFEIKKIAYESTRLCEKLYEEMKDQLESIEFPEKSTHFKWNVNFDKYKITKSKIILEISDLLQSASPIRLNNKDLEMLKIDPQNLRGDITNQILEQFLTSKVFEWIYYLMEENKEMYYGSLTEELHDNLLISAPNIKREQVKVYLTNILNWIEYYEIPEFSIDRPKYSQRLRRNN